MKKFNMNIFAALAVLVASACTTETPYMPAAPGGDTTPEVSDYQPITLSVSGEGSYQLSENDLTISLSGKNSTYGVCLPKLAKGHFIAELSSDKTSGFGIAIVQEKNGKPDFNNYTSVSVCLEGGVPTARVLDRQGGNENVLDNTGKIKKSDHGFRYSIPFTNSYFSVPFDGSTGKVRIVRNNISGFFHFYVSVGKLINGSFKENWIELAQSKDWADPGQRYFVCPIVRSTTNQSSKATFSDIRFEEFASSDVVDEDRFSVSERNYTWAGFPGQAIVMNFPTKHCPAAQGGRKFVFWSEMNYVPAWHMNNELLYCYEFAETWSLSGVVGCFEPMSDRLLAYTKVQVLENSPVRKTVKYHYALINPDYKAPFSNGLSPEVDEIFTFYPDGVGVRRIEYYLPLGVSSAELNYHELSEPMVISGSSTTPVQHVKQPAFVISNLSGATYSLYPEKPFDEVKNNVKNWSEQIYRARLQSAPDAFSVFSYSSSRPEVSPLPIENDLSWHDTRYQMSHWPVDKQPYLGARDGDYDKSNATWSSQVSHSSFIGVEAKGNTDWSASYQTDPTGRKFRAYLMLLGINQSDASDDVAAHTRGWLEVGTFDNLTGVVFDPTKTGFSKRELVLSRSGSGSCSFRYSPTGKIKNPVFRIDNWSGSATPIVKLEGVNLAAEDDYICDKISGSLVLWLKKTTDQPINISIE